MRNLKRKLALLLAIVMVVGMLPMHVFGRGSVIPLLVDPIRHHWDPHRQQIHGHHVDAVFNLADLGALGIGSPGQTLGDLYLQFRLDGGNDSWDSPDATFFAPLTQTTRRITAGSNATFDPNMWPAWVNNVFAAPEADLVWNQANPTLPQRPMPPFTIGSTTQRIVTPALQRMVTFELSNAGPVGTTAGLTAGNAAAHRLGYYLGAAGANPDLWTPVGSQTQWGSIEVASGVGFASPRNFGIVDPGSTYRTFRIPLADFVDAVREGFGTAGGGFEQIPDPDVTQVTADPEATFATTPVAGTNWSMPFGWEQVNQGASAQPFTQHPFGPGGDTTSGYSANWSIPDFSVPESDPDDEPTNLPLMVSPAGDGAGPTPVTPTLADWGLNTAVPFADADATRFGWYNRQWDTPGITTLTRSLSVHAEGVPAFNDPANLGSWIERTSGNFTYQERIVPPGTTTPGASIPIGSPDIPVDLRNPDANFGGPTLGANLLSTHRFYVEQRVYEYDPGTSETEFLGIAVYAFTWTPPGTHNWVIRAANAQGTAPTGPVVAATTLSEDDEFFWVSEVTASGVENAWSVARTWRGARDMVDGDPIPTIPGTGTAATLPIMQGIMTATLGVRAADRNATLTVEVVRLQGNAFPVVATLVDAQRLIADGTEDGVNITLSGAPALMTSTHARIPRIDITERRVGGLAGTHGDPEAGPTTHDLRLTAPRGFRWDVHGLGTAVGGENFGIGRSTTGEANNVWAADNSGDTQWWLLPDVWGPANDRTSINPATQQDEMHLRIVVPVRRDDSQAITTPAQIRLLNLWLIADLGAPATGEVRAAVEFGFYSFNMGTDWINPNAPGFMRGWRPADGAPIVLNPGGQIVGTTGGALLPNALPTTAGEPNYNTHLGLVSGRTPEDRVLGGSNAPTGLAGNGNRTQGFWQNLDLHIANIGEADLEVIGPAAGRWDGIVVGRSGTTNFIDPQRGSVSTRPQGSPNWNVPAGSDGDLVGGINRGWRGAGGLDPQWLNRGAPSVRIREIASGTMMRAAIESYRIELMHPGVRFVDVQVSQTIGQGRYWGGPGNSAHWADGAEPPTGTALWGGVTNLPGRRVMTNDTFTITPTPVIAEPEGRLRSLDFRFQLSVEPGAAVHGTDVEVRVYRDNTFIGTTVIAEIYDPIVVIAGEPRVEERDLFDILPPTPVAPITFAETEAGILRPMDQIWVYVQATSNGVPIHEALGAMNLSMLAPPTVNTADSGLVLRQLSPAAVAIGTEAPARLGFIFEVVSPSRGDVPGEITFDGLHMHGPMMVRTDYHVVLGGPVIAPNNHLNLAQPPRLAVQRDYLEHIRWVGMPYSATALSVRGTHAAEDQHPGIQQPDLPGITPPGVRPIAPRPAQRYERNAFMSVLFDTAWYEIRPVINHPNIDGVTLLANRVFAQFIDADIHWNDARREVTVVGYNATGERTVVAVIVNEPWATVNGVNVDIARFSLDMTNPINERLVGRITPLIVDDATYLPLRFMATAFGMDLDRLWNENDPDAITLSW